MRRLFRTRLWIQGLKSKLKIFKLQKFRNTANSISLQVRLKGLHPHTDYMLM